MKSNMDLYFMLIMMSSVILLCMVVSVGLCRLANKLCCKESEYDFPFTKKILCGVVHFDLNAKY